MLHTNLAYFSGRIHLWLIGKIGRQLERPHCFSSSDYRSQDGAGKGTHTRIAERFLRRGRQPAQGAPKLPAAALPGQ